MSPISTPLALTTSWLCKVANSIVEPKKAPLQSEADLFNLTMDQLLPIKTYVLDPDTGIPKLDEDGKPKIVAFFSKQDKQKELVPAEVAIKLLKNIEEAKTRPLWRILVALSIRHVGPGP